MDEHTTMAELRGEVAEFVAARDWNRYHTPKNLSMSIAIEAAEIMEHFQWLSLEQAVEMGQDAGAKAEIAEELADVLIYCLSFANAMEIDVAAAIRAKLARNEGRFPVEVVSGKLGPFPSE